MTTQKAHSKDSTQPFYGIPLWWIPYLVLTISLLMTSLTAWLLWTSFHETHALRFQSDASRFQSVLVSRMNAYEAILRSTSSMITVNPAIDDQSFHHYVTSLNIAANYPGVQGIGYSVLVKPGQETELIRHMQAEGQSQFKLWPDSAQDERHAIIYLEPLDQRNQRAIGFDMFSEPIRREAMQAARDTGQPAATSKVILVQEDGSEQQPGFLMYVPVYSMLDGRPPATIEERRQSLLGFAYSPFRIGDLITNVLSSTLDIPIDIQIYDGSQIQADQLLYQQKSNPLTKDAFTESQSLHFAGHEWTIIYSANNTYEQNNQIITLAALLVGFLFSIALFLFSHAQIQARYRAETAVSVRDSFLWIASHELRSPLTALLGNAQLLEMRSKRSSLLAEREQHNLQAIIQQGQRMNRMISVLLDHSQIKTGTLHVERKALNLVPVVHRVMSDLQDITENHSFTLEAPEQLIVDGDELRLEQVFYNLINNAIKYSPDGGTISVRLFQESNQALIQVSDQGLGIPIKEQKRLFNEFYRASNVKDSKISGSGLGLYVINEIIRQHDGTINLQSEPGKGSTFTINIPLASTDQAYVLPTEQVFTSQ